MSALFGKELLLDIPALEAKIGRKKLAAQMLALGARVQDLKRFSRPWKSINYDQLFILAALAESVGIELVRTEVTPFWKPLTKFSLPSRLIVGFKENGRPVEADDDCAKLIVSSVIEPEQINAHNIPENEIREWMRSGNVICVGGSKVNPGTTVALQLFNELGGPQIRFEWPDWGDRPSFDVAGPSQTSHRRVIINGEPFEENQQTRRFIGIVAFCREPFGTIGTSTVVISGCSRQATEALMNELAKPSFNLPYDPRWEHTLRGKPIVLLFDSNALVREQPWKIIGAEKSAAPRGRPKKVSGTL